MRMDCYSFNGVTEIYDIIRRLSFSFDVRYSREGGGGRESPLPAQLLKQLLGVGSYIVLNTKFTLSATHLRSHHLKLLHEHFTFLLTLITNSLIFLAG